LTIAHNEKVILRLAVSMLVMIFCPAIFSQNRLNGGVSQAKLEEILSKAIEYCRRLESASLDFVCVEEAAEKIDYSRDLETGSGWPVTDWPGRLRISPLDSPVRVEKNSYIYDYQFVRKGPQKIERRILVKKNGKKMHQENVPPLTSSVRITNMLYGPIGLLGPAKQSRYEFRIIGEGMVDGQKSYILETTPRFIVDENQCYGKIWVKADDSSVMKIEWDQTSLGNFHAVEAIAEKYKAEPLVTSISEYGLEKNGIRFPSRDFTEEAYIMRNGKKFVRSTTTILYKDYKFFTVETEVKY
jgi:hypothetical protein